MPGCCLVSSLHKVVCLSVQQQATCNRVDNRIELIVLLCEVQFLNLLVNVGFTERNHIDLKPVMFFVMVMNVDCSNARTRCHGKVMSPTGP